MYCRCYTSTATTMNHGEIDWERSLKAQNDECSLYKLLDRSQLFRIPRSFKRRCKKNDQASLYCTAFEPCWISQTCLWFHCGSISILTRDGGVVNDATNHQQYVCISVSRRLCFCARRAAIESGCSRTPRSDLFLIIAQLYNLFASPRGPVQP